MLEHAEALVAAAEMTATPIILQISENCVRYHGSLAPIVKATLEIARESSVPIAVHLDHAEDQNLVRTAVELGITSVMYDGSKLDYEMNVASSREIANFCHAHGVGIEVELGEVGGKDGVHAPGIRTDPIEARKFVEATDVDSLAVAVGSSHAMTTRNASLDFNLISRLRETVPVPLVLHGSSGVSDGDLKRAITSGMTKINIATHLNNVFTQSLRALFSEDLNTVDPRKYLIKGRDAITAETARLIGVLNS